MKWVIVTVLMLVALCNEALAAGAFTDCRAPFTSMTDGVVSPSLNGGIMCYIFDTAGTDSGLLSLNGVSNLICFDPDVDGTVGSARVEPEVCPYTAPGTVGNQCIPLVDAPLNGVGGSETTQTACIRVGPGSYRIDVTAAPVGVEHPVVSFRVEEKN